MTTGADAGADDGAGGQASEAEDAGAAPLSRHFRVEAPPEAEGQEGQEAAGSPVVTEVPGPGGEEDSGPNAAPQGATCDNDRGADDATCDRPVDEFREALARQRSRLAAGAQTFESEPSPSRADAASNFKGAVLDGPPVKEWLLRCADPEEDRRAEFFAAGLEERGALPAHCPLPRPGDARRLQLLADELAKLKKEIAADKSEREALAQREELLRSKEQALESERAAQREKEEAQRNYPRPTWLAKLEGTINVGVVGNSGVGKSLLINRLRGLQAGAAGWAPVGVQETTKIVSMYAFPCDPRVRLWDLPGAGTPMFPLKTYIARMGLRYLDMVIIVTAGRFTETDVALMQELRAHGVPFFMVRTKIDIDVWNNQQDNGLAEQDTLRQIRADLLKNCGAGKHPYLVSLRNITAFDFPKLLSDVFPCLQQGRTNLHAGWDDAWSLPIAYSKAVTSIQGRWTDRVVGGSGYCYYVRGLEVHATDDTTHKATMFTLSEDENGKVWLLGRWWIDADGAAKARVTSELRWVPVDLNVVNKPFIWRWRD